jgi:hypothetical protein
MSEADKASPFPRRGRNNSSDRARRRPGAVVALGVEQQRVQRRRREHLALQRRQLAAQALVDRPQRVGHRLALRALDERRELDELEVARDRVRDVEVGVEAQLAQALADARDV